MSKLAERIRKATRPEAAPIGFGAAAGRKSAPPLLLLAREGTDRAGKAGEAARQGADLLVFQGDISRLKAKSKELSEVVAGVRLPAMDDTTVANLKELGIDFAVFDAQASAADALLDNDFGFVLALENEVSDVTLRVIDSLGMDALLAPPLNGPLTVQHQMNLKRLSILSRTPLLLEIEPSLSGAQLRALHEAGVVGVIVDGSQGQRLAELRQAIDRLPTSRRSRRGEERAEAIVPPVSAGVTDEVEEEDYP
jgi:hypothetical protein